MVSPDALAGIAEGEALMMTAPKETWAREWTSLTEGGELERYHTLKSSDEADPALLAYYETVLARYRAAVRVGVARRWLNPADFATIIEEQPCPKPAA